MTIKIIIADDHSMVREGIKQLIELESDLKVVGMAGNGAEAINMINEYHPDVLLLDVNMPVLNGIETLKKIRQLQLDVKVIMLTMHNENEYLIKSVEMGCDGYILKEANSVELKTAIYSTYNGKKYIQPELTPILNSYLVSKPKNDEMLVKLTKREIEVLKLVALGMFNKDIAAQLKISERTVKNHISNIFKKINVEDRTQAAIFAVKNDLIDISM